MSTPAHTPESILAALADGPVQFKDLRHPGQNPQKASGVQPILNALRAQGKVKRLLIECVVYWAMADWKPSNDDLLRWFENGSVRTVDGCLRWKGAVTPGVGPVAYGGKAYVESITRMLWRIKRETPGPDDIIRPTCGDPRCIEYQHLGKTHRGEKLAGRQKSPVHRMRMQEAMRAKETAKITMEDARAIRASTEPTKVLMERYGLSRSSIIAIRAGKSWKEPTVGGMFTGLLADERKAA